MRYLLPVPLLVTLTVAPASLRAASAYSLYDLLPPATHSFDILYDVSIDREGAAYFFNPIRPGSVATKERVVDLSTGKPLEFGEVDAKAARESGLVEGKIADDQKYIRVKFAHPVPKNGEVRIRIYKTYTDPPSYYQTPNPGMLAQGLSGTLTTCTVADPTTKRPTGPCPDDLGFVFDRPLGIKRNVVVLPKGYELVGSQSPGIVSTDADGRVRISFLNDRDDQLPVKIIGRKLP
jgi:hypothetical protein